MTVNKIYEKECLAGLRELPENSVDCCITSPPYFGLRDYGVDGQLGLERTPEMYVSKLVEVFTEVKRVLKKEGTLWLNLGDSYYAHNGTRGNKNSEGGDTLKGRNNTYQPAPKVDGRLSLLKQKDLIGIPWMVAFALRSSGWYLRQDIIWSKPNPMPESVKDRCTKAHEYIFLLSKDKRYYFDQDAIKQPMKAVSVARMGRGVSDSHKNVNGAPGQTPHSMNQPRENIKNIESGYSREIPFSDLIQPLDYAIEKFDKAIDRIVSATVNKRSVWTVTTKPFKGAHFATFPEALISDMIKAGCPENGIVLDPFIGAGTTAVVAAKLKRNYIGFELNADYIKIAEKRIL